MSKRTLAEVLRTPLTGAESAKVAIHAAVQNGVPANKLEMDKAIHRGLMKASGIAVAEAIAAELMDMADSNPHSNPAHRKIYELAINSTALALHMVIAEAKESAE